MFKQVSLALGVSAALLAGGTAFAAKGDPAQVLTPKSVDRVGTTPDGTPIYVARVDVAGIGTHAVCDWAGINPANTTIGVNLGPDAIITGFSGTGGITGFDPSWVSEVAVVFWGDDPDGAIRLRYGATSTAPGVNVPFDIPEATPLDLSENELPNITTGAAGVVTLEFCDSFWDTGVDPNGEFVTGEVRIHYFGGNPPGGGGGNLPDPVVATVPANSPWTLGLLAGALGLLGFGLMRRRG